LDESLPLPVRSRVFYSSALNTVQKALQVKLNLPMTVEQHQRLLRVVKSSLGFLGGKDALKALGSLMSHDDKVYTHSTNVFSLRRRHARYLRSVRRGKITWRNDTEYSVG